jgi:predicted alpha/beta hydrolase family esterase
MNYSKWDHIDDGEDEPAEQPTPPEKRWLSPRPFAITSGSGWNIRADASGRSNTAVVKRVIDDTPVEMIGEAGDFLILADGSGYALKSVSGVKWRELSPAEAAELESTAQERAAAREAEEQEVRAKARARVPDFGMLRYAHQKSVGPQQLRAVIVPGTSPGTTDIRLGSWYGWLARQLRAHPAFGEVVVDNMPDPMCNDVNIWVDFMLQGQGCDANTVVIGHSAGTASTLQLLERHQLWGAILVASCPGSIVQDAWPRIRQNVGGNVFVMHGDDDLMTPLSNGEHTAEMLEVSLQVERNVGHFNQRMSYRCVFDAAVRAATALPTHGCHKDGCHRRCCCPVAEGPSATGDAVETSAVADGHAGDEGRPDTNACSHSPSGDEEVACEELDLDAASTLLIDVREERLNGHVRGSWHTPAPYFVARDLIEDVRELAPSATRLVLYSAGGGELVGDLSPRTTGETPASGAAELSAAAMRAEIERRLASSSSTSSERAMQVCVLRGGFEAWRTRRGFDAGLCLCSEGACSKVEQG